MTSRQTAFDRSPQRDFMAQASLPDEHHGQQRKHKQENRAEAERDAAQATFPNARVRIVNKTFERRNLVDHADRFKCIGHALPPPGIHVTDIDNVRQDHRAHRFGFELQMFSRFWHPVFIKQQIDDLVGMLHRISPALQRRPPESLDPIRVVSEFLLRGKHDVAVIVDAIGNRTDDFESDTLLLEHEGLIGQIGIEGVDLAGNEILDVVTGRHDIDGVRRNTLAHEHGDEIRVLAPADQHNGFADEIMRRAQTRIGTHQQDRRRMLEDRTQGDQRLPFEPLEQDLAVGRPVLRPPGEYFLDRQATAAAFVQANVKAGGAVEAFLERRVIAGELELVQPAQLTVDDLQLIRTAGKR